MSAKPGDGTTIQQTSFDESIDWDRLQREFDEISSFLDFELLAATEYEELRLYRLTYGLAKTPVAGRISEGKAVYVWPTESSMARQLWAGLAYELGLPVPSGMDIRPDYLKRATGSRWILRDIKRCLIERRVTDTFLGAWARLHALEERFHILFTSAEASGVVMEQALTGAEKSVDVQKHWYAHWLKANASSFSVGDREAAAAELAALCWEIHEKRIAPWDPYPDKWFSRLLALDDDDSAKRTERLTDNLLKLGEPSLKKMLRHRILTPTVLPPLSAREFRHA